MLGFVLTCSSDGGRCGRGWGWLASRLGDAQVASYLDMPVKRLKHYLGATKEAISFEVRHATHAVKQRSWERRKWGERTRSRVLLPGWTAMATCLCFTRERRFKRGQVRIRFGSWAIRGVETSEEVEYFFDAC